MTRGVILFAHNSEQLDYGLLALIAGGLAKKNLSLPVSLITDKWTISWLKNTNKFNLAENLFDKIIEVEKPLTKNVRNLHDGFLSETVPFINSNRHDVFELTPYDETLMIDSDFLIFTNTLNQFWDLDSSLMLSQSINDVVGNRVEILDHYVSETGVHLYWATAVMFKKDKYSQLFFSLVDFIKENYRYYADLFRFDHRQYRNDISFSVAKHILDGFYTDTTLSLPPLLTVQGKDILNSVDENGKMIVLLDQPLNCGSFWATTIKDIDVHIMNKQSIIRNSESFLKLL